MHWKFLELDAATASERDVKRAYARRLKSCRPDRDPEGFRQLHNAYQAALADLGGQEIGDLREPPADFEMPPVSSPPSAMGMALEKLEDALRSDDAAVAELVKEAEVALYECPAEAGRWGQAMQYFLGRYGGNPNFRLRPDALVFELAHQSAGAILGIVDRLEREENGSGIASLAAILMRRESEIRTPEGGVAASRLACAAAYWARDKTGELADFAYRHLVPSERDFHMQMIDRQVAIAQLLDDVPSWLRNFWRVRLIHGGGDWSDDESQNALKWLTSAVGSRNAAFEVLRGLVPVEVAASLMFKNFSAPGGLRRGVAAVFRATSLDGGHGMFLRFLIFPLLIAFSHIAWTCHNSTPPPPVAPFHDDFRFVPQSERDRITVPPPWKQPGADDPREEIPGKGIIVRDPGVNPYLNFLKSAPAGR